MNCPICNIPLTMAERQGVEIDYCSKCRGVWLDRGELDKIDRAARGGGETAAGRNRTRGRQTEQPRLHGQSARRGDRSK